MNLTESILDELDRTLSTFTQDWFEMKGEIQ